MNIETLIATDAAATTIVAQLTAWGWLPDLKGSDPPLDVVRRAGGSGYVCWRDGQATLANVDAQIDFNILVAARLQPQVQGLVLRFTPPLAGEAATTLAEYLRTLHAADDDNACFFYIGGDDAE